MRSRPALRRWRLVLLPLAAALAASCSSTDATAPMSAPRLDLAEGEREVIIRDEEWRGLSGDEPLADIAVVDGAAVEVTTEDGAAAQSAPLGGATLYAAPLAGSASFSTAALPVEPTVRVGLLYAELTPTVTGIRMSGKDAGDPYELRRGSAAGPLLTPGSTGLTGDVVVTISGTGSAAQLRIALPTGAVVITPGPVVLVSASGSIRLARSTSVLTATTVYRGTAEARLHSSGARLIGINELPIEQYLYGVVPRELGPIAFPELEALKAQAVAARTYAARRLRSCPASRCGNGYHLIPTTGDQVYGSSSGEYPLSTAAVEGTRGLVATYQGGLIESLYSSTTGGWTANSEDVFSATLPYSRSVPDAERGEAFAHVPTLEVFRRHANPTNLRNHANGDFEADWSAYHRWYVDWTMEEMRQVVGRVQLPSGVTFIDPGQVYAVTVINRTPSARIDTLEFVTEKRGTLRVRKDAVRSALRYVTYSSTGAMTLNSLRSILVYVEPIVDPTTKAIVGWEAWGGGWGHGVGLSQTGAVGMAEKGHTFEQILGHYYQGSTLEQRWE